MLAKRISTVSGAILLALTATASAGPMNITSGNVVAPRQTQTEQVYYRYYGGYGGWNSGAAVAGAAIGLLALGTMAATAGSYGWGYGYPYSAWGYGYPSAWGYSYPYSGWGGYPYYGSYAAYGSPFASYGTPFYYGRPYYRNYGYYGGPYYRLRFGANIALGYRSRNASIRGAASAIARRNVQDTIDN